MAALGLSIIFGVSGVLNVAHGEFIMMGGLMTFILFASVGLNPFLALLLIFPLFLMIGFVFDKTLIRPIAGRPYHELLIASILVTLGLSMAVEDVVAFLWGPFIKSIPYRLPTLNLGFLEVESLRLVILIFIVGLTLGLHIFFRKSYVGKAIRAITQDLESALMIGINIPRVSMISTGLATGLAATAGLFIIMIATISPTMGLPLTLKCLTIVVLGGLGSLIGPLVGGIILGLAETFTGFYVGAHWAPTVSIFLLILILLVKPEGLFGYG